MQFDADHLFALSGYAEADADTMANHIRNGVPEIAEREYADTLEVMRMFKGDSELSRLAAYPAPSAGGSAAWVPPSSCEPAICRSNPSVLPPAAPAGREQRVVGGLNE
jgi:hypothetical protein